MSHEVSDFQKDVLDASNEIPILVDFWAPWCGPCRVIGPVLEKLAAEADGKWKLAKVNVDVHQQVASTFRIQSIPAVKLFHFGEVINEFVGALPEPALRQWLEEQFPSEQSKRLQEALTLLEAGKVGDARRILEELTATHPTPDAQGLLAKILVMDEPDRALKLVEHVEEGSPVWDVAEDVRLMASLLTSDDKSYPADPVRSRFMDGLEFLRKKKFNNALAAFVDVVSRNKSYHDDAPRRACIAIFRFLGDSHPLTEEWRPKFTMALY